MKCPNCGAEIKGNTKFCEFCGSSITPAMRREQEQMNKVGCPRCGSANVTFTREKQGEYKGKKGTTVVRSTVGVCKDCGFTWQTDGGTQKKKSKTWLWVLGWILIFPVPLTILMLRKKEMKPVLKYGIIAAAWLIFFILGSGGSSKEADIPENSAEATATISSSATSESIGDRRIYDDVEIRDVLNGSRTEKIGEYSVIRAASNECTEEVLADWYYNFVVPNNYNYNVIIFTDKEENTGCYSINGMVEVGVQFTKDEYGDYIIDKPQSSDIYAPAGDGKNLTKLAFNTFYLTEGEKGKYGIKLTMNEGTEFEETKFYYQIPAGEYTIVNYGKNAVQLSIYSIEVIKNEDGWEEFAACFGAIVLKENESGSISVGENQYIELTEGAEIYFEKTEK